MKSESIDECIVSILAFKIAFFVVFVFTEGLKARDHESGKGKVLAQSCTLFSNHVIKSLALTMVDITISLRNHIKPFKAHVYILPRAYERLTFITIITYYFYCNSNMHD